MPVVPAGDPLGSQVSLSEPLSVQTSQFYSSLGSDTDSLHSRGSHDKVSPHTAKAKGECVCGGGMCVVYGGMCGVWEYVEGTCMCGYHWNKRICVKVMFGYKVTPHKA